MKTNNRPAALITVTGLFAAMIALMTAYIFHIPYGANGGYIHFGDALIYIAAVLLPRPYALAAAAIGGGLADLMTAPMWAPATILIKMLITLPFTSHSTKMLEMRNIIAPLPALFLSGSFAAPLASLAGSAIQSGGSAVIFLLTAAALDRIHIKAKTQQLLFSNH